MNFEKIGVVGAGSWGTALATVLSGRGASIALWGHNPARIDELKSRGVNETYLPGVTLGKDIVPTNSLADLASAELILFVTPSKVIAEVARQFAATATARDAIIFSCTKGIEQRSGRRMTEILQDAFPDNIVGVLSGPGHAEEVARKMPTAIVLGCENEAICQRVQQAFSTKFFRSYTSDDVAGIELGGALKNVFAIAAGVSDGLGLGDNSKAGLVTRALAEMTRLGSALGGRRETFQGLSGIGDLIVTCFSQHSRNRGVGERLGRGETMEKILSSMTMVAEGVPTALSAFECAQRLGINAPIIEQVHAVIYEKNHHKPR